MINSITRLAVQDNPPIKFYVANPALAEARIITARWPEAKERAMRAADTVEAGGVKRVRENVYRVFDLDTQEIHKVSFSTVGPTGGYACTCGDWFTALLGHPGAAPYPRDWAGCSPMCTHTLAVEIGTRIEAIEDEPIPFT